MTEEEGEETERRRARRLPWPGPFPIVPGEPAAQHTPTDSYRQVSTPKASPG